jgi:hypothetical protein
MNNAREQQQRRASALGGGGRVGQPGRARGREPNPYNGGSVD